MLTIKKELMLLVPGIRIFLDVEGIIIRAVHWASLEVNSILTDLADISGLESNIEHSDSTLLFLSKGYFASWNCLREGIAACLDCLYR